MSEAEGEIPVAEIKAAAIQDFLELAKKGEINRESIIEGWRRYSWVTTFEREEKSDSKQYDAARDIYISLVNPNHKADHPEYIVLYKPTRLLQGVEWKRGDLEKAQKFCDAMLEVVSRRELDKKYPPLKQKK